MWDPHFPLVVHVTDYKQFKLPLENILGLKTRKSRLSIYKCLMVHNLGGTATSLCTFEDSSICGYQQDTNDNFDWSRKSGRTGSTGTGPPSDHTYGTSSGMICLITLIY